MGARFCALFCAVSLGFAACGGGVTSGGSGGAATKSDIAEFCRAQCERQTTCSEPDPACQADCVDDVDHPENYRKDFVAAFAKCLQSLDCATGDDECLGKTVQQINPNWQEDALYKKCMARHAECESFSDDTCIGAVYFTSPALATLESCLDQPCDAIDACLSSIE